MGMRSSLATTGMSPAAAAVRLHASLVCVDDIRFAGHDYQGLSLNGTNWEPKSADPGKPFT